MIGGIRVFLIAFAILTVVYFYLSIRQRWRVRRTLEKQFDRDHPAQTRDEFVRHGMADYETSLRRRLILGVYIIPLIVVATLVYVTNFM